MQIIGLTGGIASGKSLVSSWFRDAGIKVIDADFVYKQLSKPFEVLYNEITSRLPTVPLKTDRSIDWHRLGEMVFCDEKLRLELNNLTHPFVIREIENQLKVLRGQEEKIVVLSVPLLFESNLDRMCDKTIVVYVNRETQLSRLMERDGIDRDYAQVKIDSQMSLEEKRKRSDYVIDNSDKMQDAREAFDRLLNLLRSE